MDEDGLLLNFLTEPVPQSNKRQKVSGKVSGGRWKDRRKLQLSLQGRNRYHKKPDTKATGVNNIEVNGERVNRGDTDETGTKSTSSKPGPPPKLGFSEGKGQFGGNKNSYISSLFTSNEQGKLRETSNEPEVTYLPSNAPLKDAMTFEKLGLNEKLVTYLTENLRFKTPTKVQRSTIPSLLIGEKDLFIKAQTGSGKTLAFILPLIHKLMQENKHKITRESGIFAMILTPTRELANQIYGVLETVTRCHHHIVPGIVVGGEKKKSEKARIRKGVNILVGTPGRLADHIENTSSLDVSQLRYLILDEGDRLVELGFEETITKITDQITRCSAINTTVNKWQGMPNKRINVLCSATMQNNVEKLGNILLDNPEMISVQSQVKGTIEFDDESHEKPNMTAPDQLLQKVIVVPPKLRLVTLNGLFKKLKVTEDLKRTMVFFSCSDSVDFHYDVFTRGGRSVKEEVKSSKEEGEGEGEGEDEEGDEDSEEEDKDDKENDHKTNVHKQNDHKTNVHKQNDHKTNNHKTNDNKHKPNDKSTDPKPQSSVLSAPLLGPNSIVFRLHGSMTQQERTSTLSRFIKANNSGSHCILFCTDVASRGLDLPNISHVIEYDPPFTIEDHLHRIGRTARAGNQGDGFMFLLPGNEEGYTENKLSLVHPKGRLRVEGYQTMLQQGYGEDDKGSKWDIHATTWHLNIERWILDNSEAHDRAVLAFTSHVRAYATHLATERDFFNIRTLHLGHLAKSFGLRDNPKKLGKSVDPETHRTKKPKMSAKQKMLSMAHKAVKSSNSEFNY